MTREFNVTVPNGTYSDLYSLMLLVTGAVPTDGILPDRGQSLGVVVDPANSSTVTWADRNNANNTGYVMTSSLQFGPLMNNGICFRDFLFKGGAASQKIIVSIQCT